MEYNLKKIQLNHFTVHLKLTKYCKSTILQFKKKSKDIVIFLFYIIHSIVLYSV